LAGARINEGVESYRNPVLTGAVFAPLIICVAVAPFRHSFDNANAALLLVLVIVAVASFGVRPAGVVAAVSSAVWFDFFLTVPYNRLTIENQDDIETTILLVVIGAAVTEIAIWGRRQQARASRQTGYLAGVMTTSQAIAKGGSTAELIDQVRTELTAVLRIDGCRFLAGGKREHAPQLNPDGSVTQRDRLFKVERDGLPTDSEIELVVQHAGVVRGRFLLTAASRIVRPDLEQRLVAVALADQVGGALASQESTLRKP
jgi:K+-sensing histidine kinase KdpD